MNWSILTTAKSDIASQIRHCVAETPLDITPNSDIALKSDIVVQRCRSEIGRCIANIILYHEDTAPKSDISSQRDRSKIGQCIINWTLHCRDTDIQDFKEE